MRIYTKLGDKGKSSLLDGVRVNKYDLRLKTYGELDHVNVIIGKCKRINKDERLADILQSVTNNMFILCSILATEDTTKLPENIKMIKEQEVLNLEKWIDEITAELPDLKFFIFPSGTELALLLHEARVITRKAERYTSELSVYAMINPVVLQYLNRASDLFFTLARYANFQANVEEEIWKL